MSRRPLACLTGLLACSLLPQLAAAFVVDINPTMGTRQLYLRVGDGTMNGGWYSSGTARPAINPTVNRVQVTVPAGQVGNGTSLPMNQGNLGSGISHWDGFQFCNPGEVYIGGFWRRPGNATNNAVLSVTSPADLVDGNGHSIPISQISWTTSGNGDTGTQPIPAGQFNGTGGQFIANFVQNTWNESCMSFRYANQTAVPAGVYTARVTFTLSSP